MSRASIQVGKWRKVAEESLQAAHFLRAQGFWRSAVSRSYYSAMSSAHALLLQLRQSPPDRGNWAHTQLPLVLAEQMLSVRRGKRVHSRDYRLMLERSYNARLQADYGPTSQIDELLVRECLMAATSLQELAKRVCK